MSYSLAHYFSLFVHSNVPEGERCRFIHHHHHLHNPNPNKTISSATRLRRRRHHRRRLLKHHPTADPSSLSSPDQNLQIILTVERLSNSKPVNYLTSLVESSQIRLNQFTCAADEALEDLRTLVTVDADTKRAVISCRRATVEFVGALVVSSLVIIFVFRGLIKCLVGNNRFNYNNNGGLVYKRDRSLGGKEVLVGKIEQNTNKIRNRNRNKQEIDRLMMILEDDNETTTPLWERRKRRSQPNLPKWWPALRSAPGLALEDDEKEEYQRMANRLIRAILDDRMRGKDISADDIVHLRRICKTSGVRVFIDTENARDTFYRVAVDFVLNCCESLGLQSSFVNVDGEDARDFFAGLSENIGLEKNRAARMVSAAVAARTRSRFLQAWALEIQGNHSEAVAELLKICLIHRIFPPDEFSPEMEMVARGLEKQLTVDQREFLFSTLIRVCGEDSRRSVSEALGLIQPLGDVGEQQKSERA